MANALVIRVTDQTAPVADVAFKKIGKAAEAAEKYVSRFDLAIKKTNDDLNSGLSRSFEELIAIVDRFKSSINLLKPNLYDFSNWVEGKMPVIATTFVQGLDRIEKKIISVKKVMSQFTRSSQAWMSSQVKTIGKGLGTATVKLSSLLGVNIKSANSEGASLGASFGKGLAKGIDGEIAKIALSKESLSNIQNHPNLAEQENGGETKTPGVAARAVGFVGKGYKYIKGGVDVISTGQKIKQLYDKKDPLLDFWQHKVLGSKIAREKLIGNRDKFAKAFKLPSSGEMATQFSSAAMGVSAGAAAGAVIGGVALADGVGDLARGFKSKDKMEAKKYNTRGVTKMAMVGVGAKAGAAIGATFGGIGAIPGAMIGAGVGGLAALLGGNKLADMVSGAKKAEEEMERLKITAEKMKKEDLDKHFGKIALSMDEVNSVASKIIENDSTKQLSEFVKENAKMADLINDHANTTSNLNKMNWKISMGFTLSPAELTDYEATIENFVSEAQELVTQKHYTVTLAINTLITNKETIETVTEDTNAYFQEENEKLRALGKELLEKTSSIGLTRNADGEIEIPEAVQTEITRIQSEIQKITAQMSEADMAGDLEVIKAKYGSGDINAASFKNMSQAMDITIEEKSVPYEEALRTLSRNAHKIFQKDGNEEKYKKSLAEFHKGYDTSIGKLNLQGVDFESGQIMERYSKEIEAADLDGMANNIMGGLIEQIKKNPKKADKILTDDNITSLFNVEGLDPASKDAMASMYQDMKPKADVVRDLVDKYGDKLPDGLDKVMLASLEKVDTIGAMSGDVDAMWRLLGKSVSDSGEYQNMLQAFDSTEVPLPDTLLKNIDPKNLQGTMADVIKEGLAIDPSMYDDIFNEIFGEDAVISTLGEKITGMVNAAELEEAISAAKEFKGTMDTGIDAVYAEGFQTTATVAVTADYDLLNPTAILSFAGGGTATTTVTGSIISTGPDGNPENHYKPIGEKANGGFTTGPEISWIGEDGPEVIIPLGGKRRSRGLNLWERAGEILGVGKHAEGGIMNAAGHNLKGIGRASRYQTQENYNISDYADSNEVSGVIVPVGTETNMQSGDAVGVNVAVNVNPVFEVSGNNSESILSTIKNNMKDIVDELGGELASKLDEVFSNMPIKEA